MQVQVETTGPTQRKLSVTLPATEVDAAFAKIYRQLGKTARLPGFRQGKIPTGLLEAHFGHQVQGEVQNELVTTTLPVAMHQENLAVISVPAVVPGTAFGKAGEGFVRACYATDEKQLAIALDRIAAFAQRHRK